MMIKIVTMMNKKIMLKSISIELIGLIKNKIISLITNLIVLVNYFNYHPKSTQLSANKIEQADY